MISSVSPSYNNIQYYFNFLFISLFHWTAWSDYQYQWKQDKLCHQHVSLNSASVVQLCLCFLQKLMFLSCFHQHLDDFIPFAEDTAFKRMQLLSSTFVFLLVILATSLLSGDECFMSVIYHIIFSLVRLFCQTIV